MAKEDFLKGFGFRLAQEFLKASPKNTGTLARSFPANMNVTEDGLKFIIPDYAEYIEFGTGIYGPLKKPITPKNKKALAFKYKGKNVVVASVKGMRPQPFMRDTINRKTQDILKQTLNLLND